MQDLLKHVFTVLIAINMLVTPTFAAEKAAKSLVKPAAKAVATAAVVTAPAATPIVAAPVNVEQAVKQSPEQIANSVCAACHGANGNSAITLNPKLAGQHPEYLLKQLTNFKEGKRANAIMAGMVANLSKDDMQGLAKYYAGLAKTQGKAKSNGVGSLGEKIYRGGIAATGVPACASCHGANGAGIPKQYPRLSGQHADYNLQQLRTFRTGERANAPMMMTIAAKMTDAEMQAVADYMQGLR